MSTKVVVNPAQVAISDGPSFLVTARDGSIDDQLPQSFFVRDTRLVSYYEISLNRCPLKLLASSPLTHRVALYQFTNPEFRTVQGTVPYGQLIVTVRRDVVGGLHEDIDITNHAGDRVEFQLMLAIRSDFADIFQVKSQQLLARGEMDTTWKDGKLIAEYHNRSFYRGLITATEDASSPPHYANGRLVFDVALEAGETWTACINHIALADGDVLEPRHTSAAIDVTEAGKVLENFRDVSTKLQSSNAEIAATYGQALIDMGALRIAFEENGKGSIPEVQNAQAASVPLRSAQRNLSI